MEGTWWKESRSRMIESMEDPFKKAPEMSARSSALSKRENSPESFIKRITPQIHETYRKGLGYETPEEWDRSFEILGGGQSRRRSSAILERMTWEQFLIQFNSVCSSINFNK